MTAKSKRMSTNRAKIALSATLLLAPILTLCGMSYAQSEIADMTPPPVQSPDAPKPQIDLPYPHPTLPADAAWPGATVVLICGMFLAAAAVGVVVRLNTPEEIPVAHSHDEPPGGSHHHGPGGTVQPGPEHDLPGGHASDAHH